METIYLGSKIYDELNSGNMPSAKAYLVQQIKEGKRYIIVTEDNGSEFNLILNEGGHLTIDK